MNIAVIGSRVLKISDLSAYLPPDTTRIISGGARGVDACAREYALAHRIPFTEILPDYRRHGRGAPLKRNLLIVEQADLVLAFWDGKSRGTRFVIDTCEKTGKPIRVIRKEESFHAL